MLRSRHTLKLFNKGSLPSHCSFVNRQLSFNQDQYRSINLFPKRTISSTVTKSPVTLPQITTKRYYAKPPNQKQKKVETVCTLNTITKVILNQRTLFQDITLGIYQGFV